MNRPGTAPSTWLRRVEVALLVFGCSSLGWAGWETLRRIVFQARQESAFSEMERAAEVGGKPVAGAKAPAVTPAESGVRPDPLLLGRIEIPRLGVAATVREGDDDATLAIAVGHVPGTAPPGGTGNVVLAAHRDTFFRALRNIRLHDTIRISTPGRRDEYLVESTEVVWPKETGVLRPSADGRLTLVTCYPFGFVGRAPKRFIVRAALAANTRWSTARPGTATGRPAVVVLR